MSAIQPRNVAEGAISIVPLPASDDTPLPAPAKFILVQTAGNMGLIFANGTDNDDALVAVTAGMVFPFGAVSASASNTAVLLALN